MASLGILPKAQRLLDASAGLAIGWYRIPTRGPQPAANPNNHYVLPQAAIIARVNDAAEAAFATEFVPSALLDVPRIEWHHRAPYLGLRRRLRGSVFSISPVHA